MNCWITLLSLTMDVYLGYIHCCSVWASYRTAKWSLQTMIVLSDQLLEIRSLDCLNWWFWIVRNLSDISTLHINVLLKTRSRKRNWNLVRFKCDSDCKITQMTRYFKKQKILLCLVFIFIFGFQWGIKLCIRICTAKYLLFQLLSLIHLLVQIQHWWFLNSFL